MKNFTAIILLFFLLPIFTFGQCTLTHIGILSAEVNGDTVLLKNDSVCRNCGSMYSMELSSISNDTLVWIQNDTGATAYCDCDFNYSITIDSLHIGNYTAKVYYTTLDNDTNYVGTVIFTITASNLFVTPKISNQYKSSCYYVNILNEAVPADIPIKIYPNPTTGKIKIMGENIKNVLIINEIGETVLNTKQTNEIDISNFSKGIYIIKVINEKGVVTKKLIKL